MSFCLIEEHKTEAVQLVFFKNEISQKLPEVRLSKQEYARLSQFTSEKRKREFKGIIYLKNHLFSNEEIMYSEKGVPFLLNHSDKFISISHSYIYIGIIIADFKVGLDIELISDKVKRVTSKFINQQEESFLTGDSSEELTRIWTMKEVLYKAVSVPGLDYRNHIVIRKKKDTYFGYVYLENKWYVTEFTTFVKDNYIFSFNSKALVQEPNTYLY